MSEEFDFKSYGVSNESLGPILNDFMNCEDIDGYFDGFQKKFKTSMSQFKQFSQDIANQRDNILVLYFCLDSCYERSQISYKQRLSEDNRIIKDLISTTRPQIFPVKPIPGQAASTERILRDLSPSGPIESKQDTKRLLGMVRKSQTPGCRVTEFQPEVIGWNILLNDYEYYSASRSHSLQNSPG